MSSKDQNLSKKQSSSQRDISAKKVGIVVSRWNADITLTLAEGCKKTLLSEGLPKDQLFELTVPGSFELPYGAKVLINKYKLDAVICIGCVIKGETKHDEYINHAVATGITTLSLSANIPVIFGVLTPNTKEQALDRAGGQYGNKGVEAANTAIEMMCLSEDLPDKMSKIGF